MSRQKGDSLIVRWELVSILTKMDYCPDPVSVVVIGVDTLFQSSPKWIVVQTCITVCSGNRE
ncbi:MAG: hypothetical protein ACPG49_14355 [Chitinophagales bacterium]